MFTLTKVFLLQGALQWVVSLPLQLGLRYDAPEGLRPLVLQVRFRSALLVHRQPVQQALLQLALLQQVWLELVWLELVFQ